MSQLQARTSNRGRVFVFTGAGLSAESGIPTYRVGTDALWEGHRIEEVVDYRTWKNNPQLVHRFYDARRAAFAQAQPNSAHYALARWQARWGAQLLTQNVDDLLERAGAADVVHLHGEIKLMRCTECGCGWEMEGVTWDPITDRCPFPPCGSSHGVKPDMVFFHEQAPRYADMNRVIDHLRPEDTVIVLGTSCVVIPFHKLLRRSKAELRIFNSLNPKKELGEDVKTFNHVLEMPATEAVTHLEALLIERHGPGQVATVVSPPSHWCDFVLRGRVWTARTFHRVKALLSLPSVEK